MSFFEEVLAEFILIGAFALTVAAVQLDASSIETREVALFLFIRSAVLNSRLILLLPVLVQNEVLVRCALFGDFLH